MAYGRPARRLALLVRDASRESPQARLDLAAALADIGLIEEACAAAGAAASGFLATGDGRSADRASILLARLYLHLGRIDLAGARLERLVGDIGDDRGVDIRGEWVSPGVMAKTITLYEAGARLAEIVDEIAETGESVTVTQHGHPVVVLVRPDAVNGHPPADDARYGAGDHRSEPEMLLDTLRAGRA